MKKNDEGFTLIELLIVIVILGILAAVVVFAVGGITDRGQESACDADFKTLEVAYEAYIAQWGTSSAPTEAELVSGEFLRQESNLMDISGDDVVIDDADCGTVGAVYVPN
jgi:general secretion pathway protein G